RRELLEFEKLAVVALDQGPAVRVVRAKGRAGGRGRALQFPAGMVEREALLAALEDQDRLAFCVFDRAVLDRTAQHARVVPGEHDGILQPLVLGAEGEGALAALPSLTAALRRAAVDLEHAARRRDVVIVLRRQSAELTESSVHAHDPLSLPSRPGNP